MRATAFITLLAVLALVAAGCGGGSKKATPLELVSQAVSKTSGQNSAKFQLTVTETAGPVGPLTITGSGVSDNTTHSANMTLDLSAIAQLAGGATGTTSAPDAWKADVILDGTNVNDVVEYMKLPALSKLVPGGKPWLKIDVSKLAGARGIDFSQLLQAAGNQDPTQALQMIQSVGNVQQVGSAQIDGVDTTEYSGTIDPQKVAAKLGTSMKLGTKPIPVTVWIDGQGYVRKFEETLTTQNAQVGTIDVKTSVELSDFGTTADVTPPPADQTTDLTQLIANKKKK
jgi:hypothetical protein